MTLKKKTTYKILTTSLVAFAVLALMAPPNVAHATLIGDEVTVTLVGADTGNNALGASITDTVVAGADSFVWVDAGLGCFPDDESIAVDIEESTITVHLTDNTGVFFVCNGAGGTISDPVTLNIEGLDWIDFPNAILEDITRTDVDAIATTEQVTGPHSVSITIDADNAFSSETRTFVFELDKSVVQVEKSWTNTDYNWDPVCDGFVNATNFCVVSDVDNTEIGFRPANINNNDDPDDDVLADPLPIDSNGNYTAFAQVHKNDKFSNTNPGAFYALTTVVTTSNLSSVTVWEDYELCTNPDGDVETDEDGILKFVSKKITRNVKVAIADPNGDVTELTDDLYDSVGGEIEAGVNSAHVLIDQEIPADSTIYVLVKFQDNLKGFDTGDGIFDDMCHNTETVVANIGGDDLSDVIAEADLRITNQE